MGGTHHARCRGWCRPAKARRAHPDRSTMAHLARQTMAIVLAGGRGTRLGAAHDARKARRPVRRQVPHHRLRAVQLPEFRHPPHRRRDPVPVPGPDPPPAARLVVPRRALQRVRRGAARAAARTRDWYKGTADAVYQNIDILRRQDRSSSWCSPATTSTRWITPACSRARRARRRHDGGLRRGAAGGGRGPARRAGGRSRLSRGRLPGEARNPSPSRAAPTRRSAAWASTCSTPRSCTSSWCATPDASSAHDFGHDLIPNLVARAARLCASAAGQLHAVERRPPLLARRRHHRRLLGSEPGTHRASSPRSTSTTSRGRSGPPGAGAAGQVRIRPRRPPRRRPRLHGFRGLHHQRLHAARSHPLLERARAQLLLHLATAFSCPEVTIGRGAKLKRVVLDQGCQIPAGTGGGLRSRRRPHALPRHRTRGHAHHTRDAGQYLHHLH